MSISTNNMIVQNAISIFTEGIRTSNGYLKVGDRLIKNWPNTLKVGKNSFSLEEEIEIDKLPNNEFLVQAFYTKVPLETKVELIEDTSAMLSETMTE